jgi:putative transposase
VWLRRYRERGLEGLGELNRGALRHGNQTPPEREQAVVELRQADMLWGPRKLKRVLERDQPHQSWPAASTIGELLKREGLVVGRKKRRRTAPYTEPLAHADGPNRVWCADFKGWFRTGDSERIEPLTITDAYSCYLLRCQAVEKSDTQQARAIFEAAFREYGMPQAIRTDNGASNSCGPRGSVASIMNFHCETLSKQNAIVASERLNPVFQIGLTVVP